MAPLKRSQAFLGPEDTNDIDGSSSEDDRSSNAPDSVHLVLKPSCKFTRSGLTIMGRENVLADLILPHPKKVRGVLAMLFRTARLR